MSKYRKRRQKLKNHDAGHDRHNKGLAAIRKARRKHQERSAQRPNVNPQADATS
ncbi:MAG TPA: hypothetical protein VIO38_07215 [Rariglobus sp.]